MIRLWVKLRWAAVKGFPVRAQSGAVFFPSASGVSRVSEKLRVEPDIAFKWNPSGIWAKQLRIFQFGVFFHLCLTGQFVSTTLHPDQAFVRDDCRLLPLVAI